MSFNQYFLMVMDKILETYVNRIYRKSRSEKTVKTYLAGVRSFMEYVACKNGEELAAKLQGMDVVNQVNGWLDKLNQEDCSPQTLRIYQAAIKKFVETVLPDLTVNWKRVELPRLWRVEEDRIPTKEELKQLLRHGNLEDKVMVCLAASSGIRAGTLVRLRVKDVDLETYPDVGVVYIHPETTKERVKYVTFITPETKKLLKEYLAYRKRKGENITGESPLLAKKKTLKGETDFYSWVGLRTKWIRLVKKAGKTEKPRRFHALRMHTLRKFFRTSLELAGVGRAFIARLMGWKGEYMDESYFKPYIEQLLAEYRKAIPNLTIMEEPSLEDMRKKQLLDTARLLGFPEERLKKLEEILAKTENLEEAIEHFRKLGENNQNNNHKIIGENELIDYLNQGWQIVAELKDGRIIIRK